FLFPPIPLAFLAAHRSHLLTAFVVPLIYLLAVPLRRPKRARKRLPLIVSLMASWLLLHIVLCALSSRYVAILKEAHWFLYFVAVYLMAQRSLSSPNGRQIITKLCAFALGLEAAIGIVTAFTGPIFDRFVLWIDPRFGLTVLRATGTMESPNSFGGIVGFGLVWCVHSPRVFSRTTRLVLCGLLGTALLLSQSKSAILATTVSLLIVGVTSVWLNARRSVATLLKKATAFAVLAAASMAIVVLVGSQALTVLD